MLSLALSVFAIGCAGSDAQPTTPPNSEPRPLAIVAYAPGPSWDASKPPEEQALGPHLEYVRAEHSAGRLVANGLMTTSPRGIYLLEGDTDAAEMFIDGDPALSAGVLVHESTEAWHLTIDALAADLSAGELVFVLRYQPGSAWVEGKPLTEQAIASHLDYIENAVAGGQVIAGGPINGGGSGGMYLIRAADLAAAQRFTTADPGVASALFAPRIDGWQAMTVPQSETRTSERNMNE